VYILLFREQKRKFLFFTTILRVKQVVTIILSFWRYLRLFIIDNKRVFNSVKQQVEEKKNLRSLKNVTDDTKTHAYYRKGGSAVAILYFKRDCRVAFK